MALIRLGYPFYLLTPERALCGACLERDIDRQWQLELARLVGQYRPYEVRRRNGGVPVVASLP